MTNAHNQKVTNSYVVHYPEHQPRENDPHYKDFEHYRQQTQSTAQCRFGVERGSDFTECEGGLELHHSHIEFSLQNAVDLKLLEHDYPGVSNPDEVGAWVESAENLIWLCQKHHRGSGGIHHAAFADYVAEHYVHNLISKD